MRKIGFLFNRMAAFLILCLAQIWLFAPNLYAQATGEITWNVYLNFNSDISELYTMEDEPDGTQTSTNLEMPLNNFNDNYGAVATGYIVPDVTGEHTFYVQADDQIEFWLSTDIEPENKSRLAYVHSYTNTWDDNQEQKGKITLYAGESYYFEIYFKENNGGDWCKVGWTKPGEAPETVNTIGTNFISSNPIIDNTLADIKSFKFSNLSEIYYTELDRVNGTITVDVSYTTDLTTLIPEFNLTYGTSISPESGASIDFTTPQTYILTALDGSTTKQYHITVNKLPQQEGNSLLNLQLKELDQSAVIDQDKNTITIEYFEDYTTLQTLEYELSVYATSNIPETLDLQNPPASFTVTAQNGDERVYSVVVNEIAGIQGFSDDFSGDTYLSNWECRNWNNSGNSDTYYFNHDDTNEQLVIGKKEAKNKWIRFTFPDALNLLGGGLNLRMKVKKGANGFNIQKFGIKLQDENAPEGDGNINYSTETIETEVAKSDEFQELIWNWNDKLMQMDGSRIKYLIMEIDRTSTVSFDDFYIQDFRIGSAANPNFPPTCNEITNPAKADVSEGTQSIVITGITDGNPERDENLAVTASSNNQAVISDDKITINFNPTTGSATIGYTPLINGAAVITVKIKDDKGMIYSDESDTKVVSFVAQFIDNTPGVNDLATFGNPSFTHVNIGTGNQHILIIPDVNDGDPDVEQDIFFDYTNHSTDMISIDSIVYSKGDKYAILYFKDKKQTGNATVTVSVIDEYDRNEGNNPFEMTFDIPLGIYNTFGVNYGATQVAQWQDMPYDSDPVFYPGYPEVLDETHKKDDPALNLFWGKMWGFIIPPVSGQYKFFSDSDGEGNATLFLSSNDSNEGLPGKENPTCTREQASDFIDLESGKAYYFEAFHKEIINDFFIKLEWVYPGGSQQIIKAPYVFYDLDQELPQAPENLVNNVVGTERISISWDKAEDNKAIHGYMVYLDGKAYNNELIKSTTLTIENLKPETTYDIFVLAVDKSNNYSKPSNILSATTYVNDLTPPSIPAGVTATQTTPFSISIAWDASSDDDTKVYGYNVYINESETPLNDKPITGTNYKISQLDVKTEYEIAVSAMNVTLTESELSTPIVSSTTNFNWDDKNEEATIGLAGFSMETVAPATGFAIEGDYGVKSIFLSNKVVYPSFEDERFESSMSSSDLEQLGKQKSNGVTYKVENKNTWHGGKAATLEVANDQWFRCMSKIVMNPKYNYILKFAMKADATYGNNPVNWSVFRDVGGKVTAASGSVNLSSGWQQFEIEFEGIQDAMNDWKIEFRFTGLGTVWLDDVQLHIKEWYNSESKFTTVGMDILEELKPAGIRWGAIGANYDKFFESVGKYQKNTMTYGDFLHLSSIYGKYGLITVGVNSETDWYKNPSTFSNFIEYIAGPAGTTWGNVRIAEGYTQPFTENLNAIIIEMGNEVWGFDSHGADAFNKSYINYATWAADMSENYIKKSDYFNTEKMYVAFSGRSPDSNYGLHNQLFSNEDGQMDMLLISGYLGGNLNYDPNIPTGESQLAYHKNSYYVFNKKIKGLHDIFADMLIKIGRIVPQYMYEGNLTTNEYHGTVGQAVTFTDYYATCLENGVTVPDVFTLEGGQWRLIEDQVSLTKRPLYYHVKYYNTYCKGGEILKTNYQSVDSIYNDNERIIDMESVGVHAYHNDGQYGIALFSRDFEHDAVVQLDLPDDIGDISNGKMATITGDNYNALSVDVLEENVSMQDKMLITVPRYGAVYISFDADAQQLEQKPLGAFNYQKVEEIIVTSREGRFTLNGPSDEIHLDVEVLPEDALVKHWSYEFVDNSAQLLYHKFNHACLPSDNAVNGTSILRFSAADGSGVFTDVDIELSGIESGVEKWNMKQCRIYPNPAENVLTLDFNSNTKGTVQLLTFTGSVLKTKQIDGCRANLALKDVKPGIYLLKFELNSGAYVKKIIKQ